jgi:hypothetical protein
VLDSAVGVDVRDVPAAEELQRTRDVLLRHHVGPVGQLVDGRVRHDLGQRPELVVDPADQVALQQRADDTAADQQPHAQQADREHQQPGAQREPANPRDHRGLRIT